MAGEEHEVTAPVAPILDLLPERGLHVAVAGTIDAAGAERNLDEARAVDPTARAAAPLVRRAEEQFGRCDRVGGIFIDHGDVTPVNIASSGRHELLVMCRSGSQRPHRQRADYGGLDVGLRKDERGRRGDPVR